MDAQPECLSRFIKNTEELGTDGLSEADVDRDAISKKGIPAPRPVEELVGENDVPRPDLFLKRTAGVDRDNPPDAEHLEPVDVGQEIDIGRKETVTAATEAKLSREAEICYATMNLVTDYDVWHAEKEPVSVELILENLHLNVEHAKSIIKRAVAALPAVRGEKCECSRGIENCIVTQRNLIPPETKKRLHHLIAKYIKE